MTDFLTLVKERGYTEDNFPHSQNGPKTYGRIKKYALTSLICAGLSVGVSFGMSKVDNVEPPYVKIEKAQVQSGDNSQTGTSQGGGGQSGSGNAEFEKRGAEFDDNRGAEFDDNRGAEFNNDRLVQFDSDRSIKVEEFTDGAKGQQDEIFSGAQGQVGQDDQSGQAGQSNQGSQSEGGQTGSSQNVDNLNIPRSRILDGLFVKLGFDVAPDTSLGSIFKYWLYLGAVATPGLLMTVSKAFGILALIVSVYYMIMIVRRWRNYERDVVKSDRLAWNLRNDIMRSLSIRRRKTEARRKLLNAKNDSSYNASVAHEELKAFSNMKVYVNTRQSVDGYEIIRQYRLLVEVPANQEVADKLEKSLEHLDATASRLMQGQVAFGEVMVTPDRQHFVSKAYETVEDKYDYGDLLDDADSTSTIDGLESVFPTSLINDVQDQIDEIQDKALMWAERSTTVLDSFFATSKTPAKRIGLTVGSSNAMFVYDLAMGIDFKSFDRYGETLDKIFDTTGCVVSVVGGNIQVVVPLPKSYNTPINVASMYRDVYLNPDE